MMESFAAALANEVLVRKEEQTGGPDTLYIGGGTPSVLPLDVISRIVEAVSAVRQAGKPFDECTVEVNPDDLVSGGRRYIEGLLSFGVDRISMGVQSFDDGILKWMNRRHDSVEAVRAYRILRQSGVENVSLDLIFGLSQMDDRIWNETLDRILDLPGGPPEHISAYQLSVEENSALDRLVASGRYREASDDICCRQYEILCERLADAGYHHYEVSNFARPGYEAVHNSAYWDGSPYIGFGPGAHSYMVADGLHVRSWNRPSVKEYTGVFGSVSGAYDRMSGFREREVLTGDQLALERIMLALRTDRGLQEEELRADGDSAAIDGMLAAGDLERLPDSRIRIPESRFFISDSIVARIV